LGNSDIKAILKKPVRYLKGVGDARAMLFQRLGIFCVEDLITHYPREYEDRSNLMKLAQLQDGVQCAFEGVVISEIVETRPRKGLLVSRLLVKDGTGLINAVWFNQGYLKKVFNIGDKYVFFGKIKRQRTFEVLNPVYEKLDDRELKNICRIVPIYPSTGNLTQNIIRSSIRSALELVSDKYGDILPDWLRNKYQLSELNYSISNIHFPKTDEDFKNARYRLVFEELLILQLALHTLKNTMQKDLKGNIFENREFVTGFMDKLPFKLTNAQKKVLGEIQEDVENGKVMSRLVQGDVGSGKTIVAVLALVKAVKSGYQGAFMVPTSILAEQHYQSLSKLLEGTGVRIAIFTGNQTKKQRKILLEELKQGEIDIAIGTHALLEEDVVFAKLGLVVTDEQHRFGVRQRTKLSQKGENPHILVMTATPIPRTLALILYGDLDISIIDELPPGRKPVETYAVDNSKRMRINSFIRKKIDEGRQVFIICPLVDESDTVEAKAATELANRIAKQEFNDLKVGLVHGKMKAQEKDEIMKSFVEGETNILVSTTVVEVGVNIPNAAVMVIENAERFGLAQLHQLRGRVGRGEYQSFCILFNEGKNELAAERMKIMEKTNDGFVISEKDLELRGPGEFFGTRQHGIPELKIANLYRDIEILKSSQTAAKELLDKDRLMLSDEFRLLKEKIRNTYGNKLGDLSLN
jgi:ATP-dependent DNA helicase RecG